MYKWVLHLRMPCTCTGNGIVSECYTGVLFEYGARTAYHTPPDLGLTCLPVRKILNNGNRMEAVGQFSLCEDLIQLITVIACRVP